MNIVVRPVHSILEHNQVKLWYELGYSVFSMGSYVVPQEPVDPKRPPLDMPRNEGMLAALARCNRDKLTDEMVDWADVVIVDHMPSWIVDNWSVIKRKKVVWRTIGQSIAGVEQMMAPFRKQGMKIVRWSPREATIPNYIGHDAIIRTHGYPDEFCGWTGEKEQVITIGQSIKQRKEFCHHQIFEWCTRPYKRVVYGPDNADSGDLWGGLLSYEDLKKVLRESRVFFYTGTQPAPYTLGLVEAMLTGIPVVAIGSKWGNSVGFGQKTYEIPDIIQSGSNGFVTDSWEDLRRYVGLLLQDRELAGRIGTAGRQTAIELFGAEKIAGQWKRFLDGLNMANS